MVTYGQLNQQVTYILEISGGRQLIHKSINPNVQCAVALAKSVSSNQFKIKQIYI